MTLIIGIGCFVVWALSTGINGAVIAPGHITVEARRQAIQHPDGGVVTALHVREGSIVAAGDPILTLDDQDLIAQRAILLRELVELRARQDRLLAELRGETTVTYAPDLYELGANMAELDIILNDETVLFNARRETLLQSDAQLSERQVQTEAIIAGRERQLTAARRQLDLVTEDLTAQENLLERGLTNTSRVFPLRRDVIQLEGEIGSLEASIAESRSAIAGFEVERLTTQATLRQEVQTEIRTLQPRVAELREQLRLIDTRIARLTLRAPMQGAVLELQIHTIGGVVPPGAEIASIIPDDVPLVISVQIDPAQIDSVFTGQIAGIRFPSLNARTTPEVEAHVTTISADAVQDPTTGMNMFTAELTLTDPAREALEGITLQPGMPVEAFIQTDARTPASFLLKPLADYWAYALREE
jgi:HlyD family secretion protein